MANAAAHHYIYTHLTIAIMYNPVNRYTVYNDKQGNTPSNWFSYVIAFQRSMSNVRTTALQMLVVQLSACDITQYQLLIRLRKTICVASVYSSHTQGIHIQYTPIYIAIIYNLVNRYTVYNNKEGETPGKTPFNWFSCVIAFRKIHL